MRTRVVLVEAALSVGRADEAASLIILGNPTWSNGLPLLMRSFVAAVLALLALSGPLAAQDVRLSITPDNPLPGAFVRVEVSGRAPHSVAALRGTIAGQPLHFTRSGNSWMSLAGISVDAADSVVAQVVVTLGDGSSETLRARAIVPEMRVARSRLSVSSRFTQPMDSATTARIARENAKAREVGRQSHGTPRLWRSPFLRPRPSTITSRFGTGRIFNGAVTSRHLGVDFRGAVGEPVRAANRGVVALVDTFFLAGTLVYVDHGAGVLTGYFHLGEALVAVGDTVQRGQVIGRVGESGRVTGPHLHWAARYGALSVNPLDLVTLTTPQRPAAARPATPKPDTGRP